MQAQGEGDQSLLCAVVEVTFDAAAGVILGSHDALGRSAELGRLGRDLVQAVLQFGGQAHVVDDQPGLRDQISEQPVLGGGERFTRRLGQGDRTP